MNKEEFSQINFKKNSRVINSKKEKLIVCHVDFENCKIYGRLTVNSLTKEVKLEDIEKVE